MILRLNQFSSDRVMSGHIRSQVRTSLRAYALRQRPKQQVSANAQLGTVLARSGANRYPLAAEFQQ
jgi:hypothetical protein